MFVQNKDSNLYPFHLSRSIFRFDYLLFLPFFFLLFTISCNYNENLSGLHYFLDMHKQISVKSQEEDYTTLKNVKDGDWQKGMDALSSWGGSGSSLRVPPEGTVPRNYEPYTLGATDFDSAKSLLKNNYPKTLLNYKRGRKEYNTFCSPCHGFTGLGDGAITPRLSAVPSVVSTKIKGWSDGEVYHIITMGRGRMYSFASQILPEDRWAIINYLRLLQNRKEIKE